MYNTIFNVPDLSFEYTPAKVEHFTTPHCALCTCPGKHFPSPVQLRLLTNFAKQLRAIMLHFNSQIDKPHDPGGS